MSKALSVELRIRALAAVASGLSLRQAGEQFGISAATVGRWRQREQKQGDVQPSAHGGDRRSHEIERHAETILSIAAASDQAITIAEVQAALAEMGIRTSAGTLRRFFRRRQITLEKKVAPRRRKVARSL